MKKRERSPTRCLHSASQRKFQLSRGSLEPPVVALSLAVWVQSDRGRQTSLGIRVECVASKDGPKGVPFSAWFDGRPRDGADFGSGGRFGIRFLRAFRLG